MHAVVEYRDIHRARSFLREQHNRALWPKVLSAQLAAMAPKAPPQKKVSSLGAWLDKHGGGGRGRADVAGDKNLQRAVVAFNSIRNAQGLRSQKNAGKVGQVYSCLRQAP